MAFYEILMDSIRLFFLNIFIYAIFLESYVVGFMLQTQYGIELPFITMFVSGIFSFIAISVWLNVSHVWYHKRVKRAYDMMIRAVVSEIPFIILLLIFWTLTFVRPAGPYDGELWELLSLFSVYMVLFPVITFLAKSHGDTLEEKK